MRAKQVALVCKLMPLYRLGIFHELSKKREDYKFMCFGDTKTQGGIQIIPWELANKVEDGGINWIRTSNYFYIPERLLWQTGIISKILFSKYDYFVFEGGVFHLPTWLFAILCRIRGKKVMFWTHGFKGFDKGLKKIIRIWYFKLANGLLLYGNYSKNLMVENGFNEKKLFVVFNSLDTNEQFRLLQMSKPCLITEEKSKIFKNRDLFTAIFIGRLVKAKNIPFLLNAVKEFSEKGKPINCIIIGDGSEMESIKNFIVNNHLEKNIYLTGELYKEEDICKYFEMSDIMISPGNVGLNCMHSLAYGVPVITHNNLQFHGPEAEAIVPGETGLLFEHNNYKDLLLKIDEWRNLKSKNVNIKKKCQDMIINKYNPQNQAKEIIRAIESLDGK